MNYKSLIARILFFLDHRANAYLDPKQLPQEIANYLANLNTEQKQGLYNVVHEKHPEFKTSKDFYKVLDAVMNTSNQAIVFSTAAPTTLSSSINSPKIEIEPSTIESKEFAKYVENNPAHTADINNLLCGGVVDLRQIPGFPKDICEIIKRQYDMISENERKILMDILGFLDTPEQVLHFFAGAHIELVDNKEFYNNWKDEFSSDTNNSSKGEFKSRYSSHKSDSNQYAVSGNFLSEALFGTRLENDKQGITWIQLENSPVAPLGKWIESPSSFFTELNSLAVHMLDFLDYRLNGKNIGPYGKSQYVEASPLRIDVSTFSPQRRSENSRLWESVFLRHPGVLTADLYTRIKEIEKNQKSLDL